MYHLMREGHSTALGIVGQSTTQGQSITPCGGLLIVPCECNNQDDWVKPSMCTRHAIFTLADSKYPVPDFESSTSSKHFIDTAWRVKQT